MSAKQVSQKTGDCQINRVLRAEQFDAHQRAGERRVGCAREHADETQTGEQIDRRAQQTCHRVAQRGADEKQWRDFAALETAAQRHGGEQQFPPPTPRVGASRRKCRDNRNRARIGRSHAQTQIFARAQQINQRDNA